jgi:hypothetical protein
VLDVGVVRPAVVKIAGARVGLAEHVARVLLYTQVVLSRLDDRFMVKDKTVITHVSMLD